jgi:hypothetical protein
MPTLKATNAAAGVGVPTAAAKASAATAAAAPIPVTERALLGLIIGSPRESKSLTASISRFECRGNGVDGGCAGPPERAKSRNSASEEETP